MTRTEGGAVFMASNSDGAPPVLTHFVTRVGSLHKKVVPMTITTEHVPTVPEPERFALTELGEGFFRVVARYGFMDSPSAAAVLNRVAADPRVAIDPQRVTFFLGRETFLASPRGRMGALAEGLFSFLSRNASSATAYFDIPPQQVVEIGTQIDL